MAVEDPSQPVSPTGALVDKLGGELLETSAERVVGRVPVEGNTQPLGFLHGGASAVLAETLASIGAFIVSAGRISFGLEIKVNHLRPVREGWVTGTAVPLHVGATTQVWEVRLRDDQGRLVAFATCTLAGRAVKPPA
jgi:1,4-dihydroxy-2-naphthoyl-CoA hydrolase